MKIAITGGIAEGKSTILKLLAGMGFECASADAAARDIFFEPEVQAELADMLGLEGEVSPATLRDEIADDDDLRRQVNLALHPKIVDLLLQQKATFFEVPLLLETCIQKHFDAVWVAKCSPEVKETRLALRAAHGAKNDLAVAQFEPAVRFAFADSIIQTDNSIEATAQQLKKEVKSYGFSLVVSTD